MNGTRGVMLSEGALLIDARWILVFVLAVTVTVVVYKRPPWAGPITVGLAVATALVVWLGLG